jgi:hypothetical protein
METNPERPTPPPTEEAKAEAARWIAQARAALALARDADKR